MEMKNGKKFSGAYGGKTDPWAKKVDPKTKKKVMKYANELSGKGSKPSILDKTKAKVKARTKQ